MDFDARYRQVQRQHKFDCLLFDIDDTLYASTSGIADECAKNIRDYMKEKLGIEESRVPSMCNSLYKIYGTTMAGLRAIGYNFDYDEYHKFVHGRLPYDRLKPDPVLRSLLLGLPFRRVIFTNADKVHAAKVLTRLGLEDCFDGIICFETLNAPSDPTVPEDEQVEIFDILGHLADSDPGKELPRTPIMCKPSEEAMKLALKMAGMNPQRTIFFDDSARNIQAGKRIGLHTVLVGSSQRVKGADCSLESIHNVKEAVAKICEKKKKKNNGNNLEEGLYAGKVALETSVTA